MSMLIVNSPDELRQWRRGASGTIGFVPTMGALHEGHMSLVDVSKARHSFTVVSIFVNPTQFGPHEDFHRYPRPVEADLALCRNRGVDVVYMPSVAAMYPPGCLTAVEPGPVAVRWCGASRPGHFRGVCTIVLKLLHQVQPDSLYLGEKDAQQVRVIKRMVVDLNLPVSVVGCPIAREEDGLAMSSRNRYLSSVERARASALYRGLSAARASCLAGKVLARELENDFRSLLSAEGGWDPDYLAIVDDDSLDPLERVETTGLFLVAARLGTTRLIDNITLSAHR